ncbi:general transcription factor II-I repeat domain-containing protein 2-like [Oryzias latipes]
MKLQLLCRHLSAGNLAHFPSLREVNVEVHWLPECGELLSNLNKEFDLRFVDFKKTADDMELFLSPSARVPEHLQIELIEFQWDSELRSCHARRVDAKAGTQSHNDSHLLDHSSSANRIFWKRFQL